MIFRHYSESDIQAIQSLFKSVFAASEGEAEGETIGNLSQDLFEQTDRNDLFAFAAADDDGIKGAIFVTRMPSATEDQVFLLAPVAVETESQGQGIGQELINYGIGEMKAVGAKYLVTYGDPKFYSKVGFAPIEQSIIEAPFSLTHPNGWLAQSLSDKPINKPIGRCACVSAFNNPSYW